MVLSARRHVSNDSASTARKYHDFLAAGLTGSRASISSLPSMTWHVYIRMSTVVFGAKRSVASSSFAYQLCRAGCSNAVSNLPRRDGAAMGLRIRGTMAASPQLMAVKHEEALVLRRRYALT